MGRPVSNPRRFGYFKVAHKKKIGFWFSSNETKLGLLSIGIVYLQSKFGLI